MIVEVNLTGVFWVYMHCFETSVLTVSSLIIFKIFSLV